MNSILAVYPVRRHSLFGWGSLALLLLAGCGGSSEELPEHLQNLTPVKVLVTQGGQPLPGALVIFQPADTATQTRIASAMTDETGTCEPITAIAGASESQSRGVAPGRYRVSISRLLMPGGTPVPEGVTEMDARAQGGQESIPKPYSDLEASPLVADVAPSSETVEIKFDVPAK